MKTAEEWCEELGLVHHKPTYDIDGREMSMAECVKQIQLDAMKEGMRRAAETIDLSRPSSPYARRQAILDAAEQLTLP